jgi:acyl-CoA thioesterase FadM
MWWAADDALRAPLVWTPPGRYGRWVLSLLLRTTAVAIGAVRARAITLEDESVLHLRVMPGDLDINLHMNNGRYLTLMDLGRLDLMVRSGLWRPVWKHRWRPLLGSAMIRFRRSLAPFQKFQLRSRLVCWDDRWFVFEQRFESRGQVHALAHTRGLFRDRQGNIPPAQALAAMGIDRPSPPAPAYVRAWAQADAEAAATVEARLGGAQPP